MDDTPNANLNNLTFHVLQELNKFSAKVSLESKFLRTGTTTKKAINIITANQATLGLYDQREHRGL